MRSRASGSAETGRRSAFAGVAALAVLPALLIAAGAAARFQASPAPGGESVRAASREDLVYVSDYFSFIGRDAHGRVAFAIDNNRGRDGDAWQAEHFVALHDEGQGWVEVSSRELKPYSVVRHSESTPPTTAASMMLAAIIRCAEAKTLALDEQAEEMVATGPDKCRLRRTKSATEKGLWVLA